jgi:ferrous iron transport protein A
MAMRTPDESSAEGREVMLLSETTVGQLVKIERLGGERSFRRRLLELGLVPGTRIELVGIAPLGDPFELLVRGCSLSIRRAEATSIFVSELRAANTKIAVSPARTAEVLPKRAVS